MWTNKEDPIIRVLHDLYTMIIHTLDFPLPITTNAFPTIVYPENSSSLSIRRSTTPYYSTQIPPALFACLILGISLWLMLFGSVIFLLGFILMPWIIVLVFIIYFAGFLFSLSDFGRNSLKWGLPAEDFYG